MGLSTFTYTSDNQIAIQTRAFNTLNTRETHYTYTPSGKIATKRIPDTTTLSYEYDPLGYLAHLSSSDGKINHRFECNKNGKLLFAYDAVENILIQREVDSFGNVTQEFFPNNIEVKKSYDAFDRLTAFHISKLGSISYTYDPLFLRNVSRFSTDGTLQYTHQYESYDLDGNLLSERMIFDAGMINHRFDLKGRKSEISSPYFSQKCSYDACDNLIQNIIDNESTSYTYDDLSQLTSENGNTYSYDSLYNRIKKDDEQFQINHLNELIDQNYDLNGNTQYVYDPLNCLTEATLGNKKIVQDSVCKFSSVR